MESSIQNLLIEQLDEKLLLFKKLQTVRVPELGWINAIRNALGMSLRQLGQRLKITPASVKEIELREQSGAITLKSLREVADALDLKLVYGFAPKNKSLRHLIELRAEELAKKIVQRSAHTMKLEDQDISLSRQNKEINRKKKEYIQSLPKLMWEDDV